MSNSVRLEKDLYPPMCNWLRDYLMDSYPEEEIIVADTSQVKLDSVLERYGVIEEYPETVGIGMQIDVLGIVRVKKHKTKLFFIEAKKEPLTTHDLGQILVYSRICEPEKAFLFSSAGMGSLQELIMHREDLTIYSNPKSNSKRLMMIQIGKWDVVRQTPDLKSMMPKI